MNTTLKLKAVYLWNGSCYCSDLILVACNFATSHKLESAFLSDKGPPVTYAENHALVKRQLANYNLSRLIWPASQMLCFLVT